MNSANGSWTALVLLLALTPMAACATTGAGATPPAAQSTSSAAPPRGAPTTAPTTTWDGVFSLAQARRGSSVSRRCVPCHGVSLDGDVGRAPTLSGPVFTARWDGWTLADLGERIESELSALEPPAAEQNDKERSGNAARVRQEAVDALAFLLLENRYPAGADELPPGETVLRGVRFLANRPQGAPPGRHR